MGKTSVAPVDASESRGGGGGGAGASYDDLETLRSADGALGIISQHRSSGALTFAILREYDQFGTYKRTTFFPENMLDVYDRMYKLVREKLAEHQTRLGPLHERKPIVQTRRRR